MSVTLALRVGLACAVALAPGLARSVRLPLSGVRDLVADPTGSRFLASKGQQVVVIDARSASVMSLIDVPGSAGPLAVSADSRELFVGLTDVHDVAVIPLDSLVVDRVLELGTTLPGPRGLAAGRAGRIYVGFGEQVFSSNEVLIVDTVTGAILDDATNPLAPPGDLLLMGADHRYLVGSELDYTPSGGVIVDVSDDTFCRVGYVPRMHAVSSDGAVLLARGDGFDCVGVRDALPGSQAIGGALVPGRWAVPGAVAAEPGCPYVFVSSIESGGAGQVLALDGESLAPVTLLDIEGGVVGDTMVISSSGRFLALLSGSSYWSAMSGVEILDVTQLVPTVGGFRFRLINPATRQPYWTDLALDGGADEARLCTIEPMEGIMGWGPLSPGQHSVTVFNSGGGGGVVLQGNAVAGRWTDLGTHDLTGRPQLGTEQVIADPPLLPGTTREVTVRGRGFLPSSVLTSDDPLITVDASTVLGGGLLRATVTISPAIAYPQVPTGVQVENPSPALTMGGGLRILDPDCGQIGDNVPPAAVTGLRLQKRSGGPDSAIDMSWDSTVADQLGDPETMGLYEVSRSLRPGLWSAPPWQSADTPSLEFVGGWESASCRYYLVRARDAAWNRGELR